MRTLAKLVLVLSILGIVTMLFQPWHLTNGTIGTPTENTIAFFIVIGGISLFCLVWWIIIRINMYFSVTALNGLSLINKAAQKQGINRKYAKWVDYDK